ncbi:hypothetical protein [Nocardia cyriacigeorgica]|uniref:hypothetical protein n=1 Tax=Nocardia cyriacigeorgica TaxID=135487 RepID=UPI001487377A|nr:hypothetical protein [Nocardia cyriacigeorgica]
MTTSGITDRATDGGSGFSTAEIKARIKEMFDARGPRIPAKKDGSRDRDEDEP